MSPTLGGDTLLLLPVLIMLELVLSADNAIALAAIAQGLQTEALQKKALDIGLVVAFVLRITLILAASWVLNYWQFEVAGAAYLLWLVYQHFMTGSDDDESRGPRFNSLWQAIPTIALTDLAFSLDSVTTAIALSKDVLIVMLGGTIGIVALRFMAGLFIRWLDIYVRLEDAGFVTVALVGIRLLVRVINPDWVPPEWVMISLIFALFAWGFSKRAEDDTADTVTIPDLSGEVTDAADESLAVASEDKQPEKI
ncbi:MAG: TerC family protein [Phormidesmis sp.]